MGNTTPNKYLFCSDTHNSNNLVNKKEKKWTKERCKTRYITGKKITLRALAALSNRNLGQLGRWSSSEGWAVQREQFENEMRTRVKEKTLEKASERLSDRYAQMIDDHLVGYKSARTICLMKFAKIHRDKKQLGEDEVIEQLNATDFQKFVISYDKLVMGERIITGIAFEQDINLAYETLIRKGYEVLDPNTREEFEDFS